MRQIDHSLSSAFKPLVKILATPQLQFSKWDELMSTKINVKVSGLVTLKKADNFSYKPNVNVGILSK